MAKKVKLLRWLILLLFCIITGFSTAAVYVTDGNIACFYDMGDQMSFDMDENLLYIENLDYEGTGKKFTITETRAVITLDSLKYKNKWQYLTIGLSDLSTEELVADIYYYDYEGEYVGTDRFCFKEGERQLRLSAPAFSSAKIVFWHQAGVRFSVETLCFSTEFMTEQAGKIWKYGILFTLLCIPLAVWFYMLFSMKEHPIDWYAPIDFLQGFYIILGRIMLRGRKREFSKTVRKYMRIVIMMSIMVVLEFMKAFGIYSDTIYHSYLIIFLLVCIMGLALLTVEGELKRRNWRNPLVVAWCVFWGMSCISDFVVPKRGSNYYGFYGYFIFVAFGFLFFVWTNREDKRGILWEICKAVEGTFLLSIVYCLVCRPESADFRYKGIFNNPNPFGLYLAIAGGVFLCELEYYWRVEKGKFGRQFLYGMGFLTDIFFLWKTQCTTAVLSLLGIVVIWLLRNMRYVYFHKKGRRFFVTAALLLVCMRPVSVALQWGILNVPAALNTTIVYPNDREFARTEEYLQFPVLTEQVYASEISTSRIWNKLTKSESLNILLSGRLTFYSTYLRNMNLFGHEKMEIVYGGSSNYAHNGFLSYMHLYGVYTFIPYFVSNLFFFYYAIVYWKKSVKENYLAFLPFAIFCIFFLASMLNTQDMPFGSFVWFLFMFIEGVLFYMPDGEGEYGRNSI